MAAYAAKAGSAPRPDYPGPVSRPAVGLLWEPRSSRAAGLRRGAGDAGGERARAKRPLRKSRRVGLRCPSSSRRDRARLVASSPDVRTDSSTVPDHARAERACTARREDLRLAWPARAAQQRGRAVNGAQTGTWRRDHLKTALRRHRSCRYDRAAGRVGFTRRWAPGAPARPAGQWSRCSARARRAYLAATAVDRRRRRARQKMPRRRPGPRGDVARDGGARDERLHGGDPSHRSFYDSPLLPIGREHLPVPRTRAAACPVRARPRALHRRWIWPVVGDSAKGGVVAPASYRTIFSSRSRRLRSNGVNNVRGSCRRTQRGPFARSPLRPKRIRSRRALLGQSSSSPRAMVSIGALRAARVEGRDGTTRPATASSHTDRASGSSFR